MNKNILIVIAMCAAMGGVTAWHYSTKPPVAQAALDLDPSGSVDRNCANLSMGVGPWLTSKPGIQDGSTLTMLIMGVDAVNTQARLAFDIPVPLPSDSVIGGNAEEYRASMDQMTGRIERECEAAPAGHKSPIYQMVRQTIDVLRGLGCRPAGRCYILLKTDLDDDAQPLLQSLHSTSLLPAELTASLDNAGIEVEICGTTEVKPRKDAPPLSVEERVRLWKQMFTHPELVNARPFCGAPRAQ